MEKIARSRRCGNAKTPPSGSGLGGWLVGWEIRSLTMTYFHTGSRTIIGAKSFHCPVRDGKEWGQLAMVIGRNWVGAGLGGTGAPAFIGSRGSVGESDCVDCGTTKLWGQAARAISTGKLNALLGVHTLPINVLVWNGS